MQLGKVERLPYPTGLLLDIHNYCNAKCVICPYTQLKDKIPQGFMTWELYTKILYDYSELMKKYSFKGKLVYCQMAEPFILKDISKWVKYAIDRDIEIYFNTNASLLTPSVVGSLYEIGFDGLFNISFFGITKEVYERNIGINYENTMKNLEYLLQKYPNKNILINAVAYDWPKGEKEKLLKYWKERNVSATVSRAVSRTGLLSHLKKSAKKRIAGCLTERIFYEMVISFNGDVLLCCHDMSREVILGNLKESTIYEIWNGPKFEGLLRSIYFDNNLPSDFICKRCEESVSYWSPRRMIKNLLPDRVLNEIRKRRDYKWIVTKNRKDL